MIPITVSKSFRSKKDDATPPPEKGAPASSERRRKAREDAVELRRFFSGVGLAAFLVLLAAGGVTAGLTRKEGFVAAGFVLGLFALFSLRVATQWERAVVLRFGRFHALKGPGLFGVVPVVDVVSQIVDQRLRVTDVTAESALTKDTVPVNVDAIVFWTVWDAKKSVLEVADYFDAVWFSAQTALREAIGRHQLAEMITEREKLGRGLQAILDGKTSPWGITVQSVEIRDVKIPAELEDAMSRQAQAERERQARIILGTAETEIASRFVSAGQEYEGKPLALHLRAMNMLYEAIKEKGSMVIVPSSAVETMGLGGLSGLTALGRPAVPAAPPPASASS